jgi:alkylation response protein AidB-like acyl-CoA dehydrogenase
MTLTGTDTVLTEAMLARFDARAPEYDRENRFFTEDFEELREAGYLTIAVPPELGGAGLRLDEVLRLQRRLAYVAPATALAVNMHLYWTGVAADLRRAGDTGLEWLLREAAAGKVFAAGHGEAGNDIPLLLSTAIADRVEGGYAVTAHKIFGSLSPVWDYLGLHAMDTCDPANPQVVHAFLPRRASRYHIEETWDALGMRATMSNDTIMDRAFVADEHVVAVVPAGFAGAGPLHVALFAWSLLGFAAVYAGIARRAYDLTIEKLPQRTSIALIRSMAHHPGVQHSVTEMRIALETVDALLERTASVWSRGVDHGMDWMVKIVATKHEVVRRSFDVVDRALDLSGGAGIFKRNRVEQLFRDSRLGRIHPANDLLTHELIGKLSLGIDPDEQPRWG